MLTQPGAAGIGQLTFRTAFADATAEAIAAPGPLRLAVGTTDRILTCVCVKAPAAAPAST